MLNDTSDSSNYNPTYKKNTTEIHVIAIAAALGLILGICVLTTIYSEQARRTAGVSGVGRVSRVGKTNGGTCTSDPPPENWGNCRQGQQGEHGQSVGGQNGRVINHHCFV